MKYTIFPGCVSHQSCPELLMSTETVLKTIDVEFIKIDGFACCGASHLDTSGRKLNIAVNARNLALAEKKDASIITPCSTCYLTMKKTQKDLENTILMDEITELLKKHNLKLENGNQIYHLLEILTDKENIEKIITNIKFPLDGIKIAPFYGCHLIRPKEIVDGNLGPENMDNLIEKLGGSLVLCSTRSSCCGFHIQMENEKAMIAMASEFLKEARDRGADMILTSCPLCHLVFDVYQPKIKKFINGELHIPILHLPQLVGLALGIGEKATGMTKNIISAKRILNKEIRKGVKS